MPGWGACEGEVFAEGKKAFKEMRRILNALEMEHRRGRAAHVEFQPLKIIIVTPKNNY